MSQQVLDYFANCYTTDRKNPLISPAFGDLSGMPESLIFAGGDEIMRSDSELLHQALQTAGCKSQLIVTPERWHAYVVYNLDEDRKDIQLIGKFLNRQLAQENKLRWLRLDNAAKIYPAARRQNWSNVFRLSATLTEKVDVPVLQSALDVTVRRFPSLAVRLRRGVFWYYLQELEHAPRIRRESSYPLTRMSRRETRNCALRVIAYENRIAIELFHSLTDGNGALIFLKSLVAEYLQQKHGIRIPPEKGVWNRLEEPAEEELEDCFPAHAGTIQAKRDEKPAWRLSGTPEPDGFLHLTCLQVPVRQALDMAHSYGVSLTCFLAAAMLDALQRLQMEKVPDIRRRKPLSVLIPINLRKLWPSRTIRNFALYTTPEILPRLGHYSFPEICQIVQHWVALENTPKRMSMLVATNMAAEKMLAVKLMPLFIKNVVMKAIFNIVGERKSTLCFSNLGAVELPEIMAPYVQRMDFILGVQATSPYNCGILSYGDTLYLNMIRNIREPMLEYQFYCVLRDLGLPVEVQSNHP